VENGAPDDNHTLANKPNKEATRGPRGIGIWHMCIHQMRGMDLTSKDSASHQHRVARVVGTMMQGPSSSSPLIGSVSDACGSSPRRSAGAVVASRVRRLHRHVASAHDHDEAAATLSAAPTGLIQTAKDVVAVATREVRNTNQNGGDLIAKVLRAHGTSRAMYFMYGSVGRGLLWTVVGVMAL